MSKKYLKAHLTVQAKAKPACALCAISVGLYCIIFFILVRTLDRNGHNKNNNDRKHTMTEKNEVSYLSR